MGNSSFMTALTGSRSLTVTRLLLSAHAQSRAARAPFARGFAILTCIYLHDAVHLH